MTTLLASLLLLACQDADNPEYLAWKAVAPGSWVKLKTETANAAGTMAFPQEVTRTLLSVDDQKAVYEEVLRTTIPGKDVQEEKPRKRTVRAKHPKTWAPAEQGDAEIEVDGKTLKCHWVLLKEPGAHSTSGRLWYCPDVVGGVARQEVMMAAGKDSSLRSTAVAWEKK